MSKKEINKLLSDLSQAIIGRKLTEKEITKKHLIYLIQYLDNIIASMPGSVYWKDTNGVYRGGNNYLAKIAGFESRMDIIGKTENDFAKIFNWDKKQLDRIVGMDKGVMESEIPLVNHEELPFKITDGRNLTQLTNKVPLYDEDNKIIGILGISIDFTERKKREENLVSEKAKAERKASSSQEIIERIIACMPGSVYWKDTQGVYLGCNDAMASMMGLPKSEIIGKTDLDFAELFGSIKVAEAFRRADREVINSGIPVLNAEEPPFHFADGKIINQLSNRVPLLDENNNIVGVIGISIDITERKKMEEQLHQAIAAADAANRAKGEFLRNMEHQLRTPFSGVYSLVSIAAAQESNPELKELLDTTYHSGEELLSLINDIIDFSRSEVDSSVVLAKKFDLKRLIEKAIILEKPAAVTKKLEISYCYPKELPTVFISDPKRIQGILLHLLSNAIKFTPEGSINVEVRLGKQVDKKNYILQILVADTGIGISEENQNFIYERFYRASPANVNKYVGAGLGLSTVKRLVTDLHGEIDVVSKLGQGTTFICTIPFKRPLLDELIDEETNIKKHQLFLKKDK